MFHSLAGIKRRNQFTVRADVHCYIFLRFFLHFFNSVVQSLLYVSEHSRSASSEID
jgi:hypothetical protein